MSYVYVGTRNANNTETVINEVFVSSTEAGVLSQMIPFALKVVTDFVEDNIDEVENVVRVLYGEHREDDDYRKKVKLLEKLNVDEMMESLSSKEILTIYSNLYKEEEIILVEGYDKDGKPERLIVDNQFED
jgi:hypothetical protein